VRDWSLEAHAYYRGLGMRSEAIVTDGDLLLEYLDASYGRAQVDRAMRALGNSWHPQSSADVWRALRTAFSGYDGDLDCAAAAIYRESGR
jgi:hypothetical protein